MKLKEAYYYLFYKLFRFWSLNSNLFMSAEFRAQIVMIWLEVALVVSVQSYICILTHHRFRLTIWHPLMLIPFVIIITLKLYLFTFSDRWRVYNERFNKWTRRQNIIGGIIVYSVILLIIGNLFFSIELLNRLVKPQ